MMCQEILKHITENKVHISAVNPNVYTKNDKNNVISSTN